MENNKQLTGSFSRQLSILSQALEKERKKEKEECLHSNVTLIKRKLAGIHHIMHLCWINVRDLQNESKLHHVFLLVLDCDTSWLSQLQSRRANKSGWNLVLISQTDISDGKCTKQMLRIERVSCQMLRKYVWVMTVTWMGGQTNLFSQPILFWGLCAALLTEVALCPLWKHDPLRCVHVLWTLARGKKQEAGDQGKAWESD